MSEGCPSTLRQHHVHHGKERAIGGTFSAIQLDKGVKVGKFTFLLAIKEDIREIIIDVSKEITSILEEFQYIMPPELLKKLPPKREVDHEIELVLGARPSSAIPTACHHQN